MYSLLPWVLYLFLFIFQPACSTPGSKELGDWANTANLLHQDGKQLFQEGKPQEALTELNRSLEMCEERKSKPCIANNLNAMGLIYVHINDTGRALDVFQRSLSVNREVGNHVASAAILNAMGNIFYDQGAYPRALQYYGASLTISLKLQDHLGVGATFSNLGKIYYKRGDYEKALDCYNKSMAGFVALNDQERARIVMKIIRKVEGDMGNGAAPVRR